MVVHQPRFSDFPDGETAVLISFRAQKNRPSSISRRCKNTSFMYNRIGRVVAAFIGERKIPEKNTVFRVNRKYKVSPSRVGVDLEPE